MCGSEGRMFKAEIEGSILTVCEKCAKYGKVMNAVSQEVVKTKKEREIVEEGTKTESIFLIVEDFAERIKKKRESLGMNQEDFAKMLNEKLSLMHHIETGKFTPGIDLARKLEKLLHIKLVELHEEEHKSLSSTKIDQFTIGDLIKIKKK